MTRMELYADQTTYERVLPIIEKAVRKHGLQDSVLIWHDRRIIPISCGGRRTIRPRLIIAAKYSEKDFIETLRKADLLIDCETFILESLEYYSAQEMKVK